MKNVINDLNLQWFMAVNSGQAKDVDRDDFICWQALMRAAPKTFVDHIMGTLEDKERRHSFIMDALKWQQGKQEDKELVKGYFSAYEEKDSKRLRGVLRQISFSKEFTPDALDSMIYMSAPPPKPELVKPVGILGEEAFGTPTITIQEPESIVTSGEVSLEGNLESVFLRREIGATRGDGNRLTIGGLYFMRVPAGKFVMGSKDDNELAQDREKPQHTVDITHD